MTILCFWSIQITRSKDGIHTPYAGTEGHKEIKRSDNKKYRPRVFIIGDHTRNSDGRGYSGSRRIRGIFFVLVSE